MSNKRFKDFGSPRAATDEPLSFRLYGEEFECYSNVQGKVILDLVANTDEEDGASMARTMSGFFEKCVKPESLERLNTLLADPERVVDIETLGEITGWLVEQYSARPTRRPEPSESGE